MEKPSNYDSTPVQTGFKEPPAPGGHILGIVNAEYGTAKSSGNNMLTLSLDIAEGPHKNNYRELSERLGKDCYLKAYLLTDGDAVGRLKGAILAVEHSNPPFKFQWGEGSEKTLIRKLVGGNLRSKEYYKNDGSIGEVLEVGYLCGVETVRAGVPALKKKTIESTTEQSSTQTANNDLPF
jgi:hypothetical protein